MSDVQPFDVVVGVAVHNLLYYSSFSLPLKMLIDKQFHWKNKF